MHATDGDYVVALFDGGLFGCKFFALLLLGADENDPEDDKHKSHHDEGLGTAEVDGEEVEDIVHSDNLGLVVTFDKGVFEGVKSAIGDGFSRVAHEAQIEMQIMQGKQP